MKVGSLFAGIGGFDLAARWMGWETAWVSEIDDYASAVLKKHWPNAPNLGDITKIIAPPHVDILVGGFPCQDISVAGKGEGIGGERSGLWKHYARIIGEVKPKWVVIENSPRLRSLGLGVVLQDLFALGYDAEWHCIPASYVGAPHQRDRIWLVAYPCGKRSAARLSGPFSWEERHTGIFDDEGSEGRDGEMADTNCELSHGNRTERRGGAESPDCSCRETSVADTTSMLRNGGSVHAGCNREGTTTFPELGDSGAVEASDPLCSGLEGQRDISSGVEAQFQDARVLGWWDVEPDVGRVAHGVPSRVDRLKCCGNAIVPKVAYEIFQAISREEDRRSTQSLT